MSIISVPHMEHRVRNGFRTNEILERKLQINYKYNEKMSQSNHPTYSDPNLKRRFRTCSRYHLLQYRMSY